MRARPRIAALLALVTALGCSAQVTRVGEEKPPLVSRPDEPFPLHVNVEGAPGLSEFLKREPLFDEVTADFEDVEPDVVVKASTEGAFRSGGVANFFTFFPGGLLLVPTIRGVRWTYDAHAEAEVFDAETHQSLGKYQAKTTSEFVHRASVPGGFFSAVVLVPAIVRGAQNTSVRSSYKTMIYKATYDDLWRQIAAQMMADHAPYVAIARRAEERRLAEERQAQRLAAAETARARQPARRAAPPPATSLAAAPVAPAVGGAATGGAPTGHAALDPSMFYSRRVAVVVGIDKYRTWPNLTGASADAHRMAAYLRETGFDEVLEVYDEAATRKRLLSVLGTELPSHVDDNSLAFIYFAGHGQTETLPGGAKRGYLIPVDADLDDVFATGISMENVRDLSNRMTAKHVMYAIDACYSGLALTRGIALSPRTPGYLEKVTSRRAVQIITAGSEGEQAVEVGGQGIFTTYLLRSLRGEADMDGDGAVTASEIGAWVKPQVTVASQGKQTPQFGTIDGSGDSVFVVGP